MECERGVQALRRGASCTSRSIFLDFDAIGTPPAWVALANPTNLFGLRGRWNRFVHVSVREVNLSLAKLRRLRVLLADPPINWNTGDLSCS